MSSSTVHVKLWHCNWNWCPDTFRNNHDLAVHLRQVHFNTILRIKKRDYDDYLRSTEGRSGQTDSLLPSFSVHSEEEAALNDSTGATKRRRISFAECSAQSSPSSPDALPLPPSPSLQSMLVDAINAASQINSNSGMSSPGSSRIASRTPGSQGARRGPNITGRSSPMSASSRESPLKRGPNSPLTLSTTSSQAVEESLTQRPAASPPPPPIIPSDTPSPVRTQVQNDSHTPPQTVEESAPDPSPLTPPLPRTRRGSKSHAAVGAQPTRVLRSRSKTPAPAAGPACQTPLPRRTRSTTTPQPEESAHVNTGNGRRASAKPRSTSKPPSSGATGAGRRTRANPGGLEAVEEHSNEQPAEAPPPVEDSAMPPPAQNGFRSGTLAVRHPLPRRKRAGSRLQAQSEPQTVVETPPQTYVQSPAPPTSPVTTIEVKRELDIGDDPLSLTYPSYPTSRGESISEHSTTEYREGYGFDIDFLDLITQPVYPSQSQP